MMVRKKHKVVPCQHIADYYPNKWLNHPCIAYNLLRQGYKAWADINLPIHYHNNLYPIKRYKGPYSIKQALVQDYNWRMGNLRRIHYSVSALDADLEEIIQGAVEQQMQREMDRHELRLAATHGDTIVGPMLVDNIHLSAVERVSRARAERERDAQNIPT